MSDYLARLRNEHEAACSYIRNVRRIASQYATWAREGGKHVDHYNREANRLRSDVRWHIGFVRRRREEIIRLTERDAA